MATRRSGYTFLLILFLTDATLAETESKKTTASEVIDGECHDRQITCYFPLIERYHGGFTRSCSSR